MAHKVFGCDRFAQAKPAAKPSKTNLSKAQCGKGGSLAALRRWVSEIADTPDGQGTLGLKYVAKTLRVRQKDIKAWLSGENTPTNLQKMNLKNTAEHYRKLRGLVSPQEAGKSGGKTSYVGTSRRSIARHAKAQAHQTQVQQDESYKDRIKTLQTLKIGDVVVEVEKVKAVKAKPTAKPAASKPAAATKPEKPAAKRGRAAPLFKLAQRVNLLEARLAALESAKGGCEGHCGGLRRIGGRATSDGRVGGYL